MHHATWILNINTPIHMSVDSVAFIFCFILSGQRLFYAQLHSYDSHVESMYMQLLHVLHVRSLRLTPQCHAFV